MQICFDSPVCVGFVIWTSHFSKIIQLYLAVSKNEHLFVGGIYSASELQNLPMWKSSKKKWWLICKMHFFQTLLILGSLLLWSVFEVRKALHINTEPSEEIKIRVERTEGKKTRVLGKWRQPAIDSRVTLKNTCENQCLVLAHCLYIMKRLTHRSALILLRHSHIK